MLFFRFMSGDLNLVIPLSVRHDGDPIARRTGIVERIPWVRIPVQSVALRDDASASFIVCFLGGH